MPEAFASPRFHRHLQLTSNGCTNPRPTATIQIDDLITLYRTTIVLHCSTKGLTRQKPGQTWSTDLFSRSKAAPAAVAVVVEPRRSGGASVNGPRWGVSFPPFGCGVSMCFHAHLHPISPRCPIPGSFHEMEAEMETSRSQVVTCEVGSWSAISLLGQCDSGRKAIAISIPPAAICGADLFASQPLLTARADLLPQ